MASYLKKREKGMKEVYYAFGESETFAQAGDQSWKVNKKSHYFSNDIDAQIDGEDEHGDLIIIEYGINKQKWRLEHE
jgi:hypothetical protein